MMQYFQETLSDGVVTLREITNLDAPELHEMLSDKKLCEMAGLMVHTHINQTLDFIFEGNYAANNRQQYFYGIFADDVLVGLINLFNIDYLKRSGEYGYFISSNHTRKGYMERSIKLLSNYILVNTNIEKISIYVDVTNKPSLRLAEKLAISKLGSNIEIDQMSRSIEMIQYEINKVF